MADTSLIIGNGNWAVKETSLLGYNIIQSKYVPIEMTVVRATTATRVNSAGLIEVVPINLLTYSEQFDNAVWTKIGSTISANSTTAPNGTTTADKLIEGTLLGNHYINRNITNSNSLFSFSVFAKKSERNFLFLQAFATVPNNFTYVPSAYFDLDNGTVGTVSSATATIQDYGNGWYRCTLNCTSIFSQLSASVGMYIMTATANGVSTYLGNGTSGIFIWGAQAETGTTATEYFPTTDRFNIPRVDYSTGTASLLVEPQRINLALRSEEFSNASWNTASTSTVTLNAGIAPSGNNTANLITATSVDGRRIQSVSLTAGTYTYSYFVKKGNQSSIQVLAFNSTLSAVAQTADFNLDSGTLTSGTGIIQQFTNGWYRVSVTFTIVLTNTIFLYIKSGLNNNAIGSTVFAWGAQLEAGTNATSYIPTVAATVTRNADVISKTGISSLIGQTEGTIYAEINNTLMTSYSAGYVMRIFADANNEVWIRKEAGSNTYTARWRANSTNVYTQLNIAVLNGNNKIAIAYKSTDSAVYLNGSQIGTSAGTGAFSVAPSQIGIGSSSTIDFFNDRIELATLFPTRLTNAQLATLTTI